MIDGQQRLTTLPLLLDAAQEVFEDRDLPDQRLLKKYVVNDEDFTGSDDALAFKIMPTLVDREAFLHAMKNGLATNRFADSQIVQAHEFFQLQIQEWLGEDSNVAAIRCHGLSTALVGLLQMVVIDLEMHDDANIIFETLNARGTPLLASDLIKNWSLHEAGRSGHIQAAFYQKYWADFDSRWWREDIRQGRLVRPRVDVFANYWLAMRTGSEVASKDVFPRFRDYAGGQDIAAVARNMNEVGAYYRAIEDAKFPRGSVEETFLYRWHTMDAGVSTPVILWLFANATSLGRNGSAVR